MNNAFLVATEDVLALQYNDLSPLENMHVAKGFEIVRRPGHNIFQGIDRDVYKQVRVSSSWVLGAGQLL